MFLELLLLTGLLTIIVVIFVLKSGHKQRPRRTRMGVFLDKPALSKDFQSGDGPGDSSFCSVSMQGWRTEMEDTARAIPDLGILDPRLKGWSFYAVFDGHAGGQASLSCSDQLIECILPRLEVQDGRYQIEQVRTAVSRGFFEMDERLRKELTGKPPPDRSGTTAVSALVSPKHVFVANCGDSRALLARDGKVYMASADHKPYVEAEKSRIEAAGGAVLMQRVNGTLAVSRALGDFDYKAQPKLAPERQLVSPEPDVYAVARSEGDQLIVLACDGVWDVMENEEVSELLLARLRVSEDLRDSVGALIEKSLYKNSRDNMTAIIVTFPAAPKFSQAAADKDRELLEEARPLIEEKIREYVRACEANGSEPQVHVVMQDLVCTLDPAYEIPLRQQFVEQQIQSMHTQASNTSKHLNSDHRKLSSPVSPVAK